MHKKRKKYQLYFNVNVFSTEVQVENSILRLFTGRVGDGTGTKTWSDHRKILAVCKIEAFFFSYFRPTVLVRSQESNLPHPSFFVDWCFTNWAYPAEVRLGQGYRFMVGLLFGSFALKSFIVLRTLPLDDVDVCVSLGCSCRRRKVERCCWETGIESGRDLFPWPTYHKSSWSCLRLYRKSAISVCKRALWALMRVWVTLNRW